MQNRNIFESLENYLDRYLPKAVILKQTNQEYCNTEAMHYREFKPCACGSFDCFGDHGECRECLQFDCVCERVVRCWCMDADCCGDHPEEYT